MVKVKIKGHTVEAVTAYRPAMLLVDGVEYRTDRMQSDHGFTVKENEGSYTLYYANAKGEVFSCKQEALQSHEKNSRKYFCSITSKDGQERTYEVYTASAKKVSAEYGEQEEGEHVRVFTYGVPRKLLSEVSWNGEAYTNLDANHSVSYNIDTKNFMNVQEVADLLRSSTRTVRRLIDAGKLGATYGGGKGSRVLIEKSNVAKYLESIRND